MTDTGNLPVLEQGARRRGLPVRRMIATTAIVLALSGLGGCAAVYDPDGFTDAMAGRNVDVQTDEALASLTKGDWRTAEEQARATLRRNPTNGYALLVLGAVYENTRRPTEAYDSYEAAILTARDMQISPHLWNETEPDTIHKLAKARLMALRDKGVRGSVIRAAPIAGPGKMPPTAADGEKRRLTILDHLYAKAMLTPEEYAVRKAAAARGTAATLPPPPTFDDVAARLEQIRRSFENRNLGPVEHASERERILDNLIPLVRPSIAVVPGGDTVAPAPPTAAQADAIDAKPHAPVATAPAIASPGQATPSLSSAVPSGAAPVRTGPEGVALDDAPVSLVPPGQTGNPAATLRSGRSDQLVVPDPGTEPVKAEAPAGAIAPSLPSQAAPAQADVPAQASPAAVQATPSANGALTPSAPSVLGAAPGIVAVHLASFRSEQAAEQGWALLRQQFPSLMGLQPKVLRVEIPDRGVYYRLNAGPLASREVAQDLCKTLTDQYCEVAFLGS